jgi:HEAT repeat protein
MMWVCPACWEVFSLNHLHCPWCGTELASLGQRKYIETLAAVLDHPDNDTAIRAADILARRFDADETIPILIGALRRRWHEPHIAAGIVRALSQFAAAETQAIMAEAIAHESVIVRRAAAPTARRSDQVRRSLAL